MKILLVILFLGIMIFFHELGHFIAAKAFKVKVLEFALGFGPKLLKKRHGETEYSLRALPLGGLVKMLGEESEEIPNEQERNRTFLGKPTWQKIIISFSGPFANFLLPIPLFFVIFLMPNTGVSTVIGYVVPESPADKAGLLPDDRIVSVNGEETVLFTELSEIVRKHPDEQLEIVIERNNKRLTIPVTPSSVMGLDPIGQVETYGRIGVISSYREPDIGIKNPDLPAGKAGLKTWDRIVEINGQPVQRFEDIDKLLKKEASQELKLKVLRPKSYDYKEFFSGEREELAVTIAMSKFLDQGINTEELGIESSELYVAIVEQGLPADKMGLKPGDRILRIDGKTPLDEAQLSDYLAPARTREVKVDWLREGKEMSGTLTLQKTEIEGIAKMKMPYYSPGFGTFIGHTPVSNATRQFNPFIAFVKSIVETAKRVSLILVGLSAMFSGSVSLDQIGGPIMLYKLSSEAVDIGIVYFLNIIAFISLNLGIINLFPMPVLDGGYIATFLIEALLRRPISAKLRYALNLVGFFFLVSLMLFAIKNDIIRYWFSS